MLFPCTYILALLRTLYLPRVIAHVSEHWPDSELLRHVTARETPHNVRLASKNTINLFIHGWPGSFIEVDHILDGRVSPPNASLPAFHVVAPSIQGFGFSPAPTKTGHGAREAGNAFNELMDQLGYDQYVTQGCDLGAIILEYTAGSYPSSVLSILSNF